jgi:hypothetical protein
VNLWCGRDPVMQKGSRRMARDHLTQVHWKSFAPSISSKIEHLISFKFLHEQSLRRRRPMREGFSLCNDRQSRNPNELPAKVGFNPETTTPFLQQFQLQTSSLRSGKDSRGSVLSVSLAQTDYPIEGAHLQFLTVLSIIN